MDESASQVAVPRFVDDRIPGIAKQSYGSAEGTQVDHLVMMVLVRVILFVQRRQVKRHGQHSE
jgi:hypothetical protein